jgi:imidazolonepropionase-like amidohydrolase
MKDLIYLFLKRSVTLTGLLLLLVSSSQTTNLVLAKGSKTTAFVNVNVIPMDTERVLKNQTVIVEGDHITAIGPVDSLAVPLGAKIIDGNGAYLMPGLVD